MQQIIITYLKAIVLFFLVTAFGLTQNIKAQNINILAENTFNGAMTGVILGGATMGLQNSDNFAPVRIGAGVGTLFGIGVGIYDLTQTSSGEQLFYSGTFNDGTNSSIIVLLDTFYGAAAGAIIATSVTLISKKPFLDGLQYGSSAGAWVGFGFGVFDAFVLAKKPGEMQVFKSPQTTVNGLITLQNNESTIQAGFLSPGYSTFTSIGNQSIEVKHSIKLEVLNLKIRL